MEDIGCNMTIINSIFPTPIYVTNLERPFNAKELQFVQEQKKHCFFNRGNNHTEDTYILNRKEFKNIKNFLEQCCKDYLEKVICPKNNLELYITQSWLNYTEINEYHHKHDHPNSIVSGVLYIDADLKNDKILFINGKGYQQISPEVDDTKFNLWNSNAWSFPVKTGNLFMFPSSTAHQVETKKGTNTRISLSFNTFYKGTLGSNVGLTQLIL